MNELENGTVSSGSKGLQSSVCVCCVDVYYMTQFICLCKQELSKTRHCCFTRTMDFFKSMIVLIDLLE